MRPPYKSLSTFLLLATGPAAALLLAFFAMRAQAYRTHRNLSLSEACSRVLFDFGDIIAASGTLGVALVIFNYVSLFGVVVVMTAIASRWCYGKRAACFYIVSSVTLIAFACATANPFFRRLSDLIWPVEVGNPDGALIIVDLWAYYILQYPAQALPIAILSGAAVAALPMFKPTRRYWLKRGMCPKCHYDLQGKTDVGCPECGWNRPAASIDEMAERNGEG